LLASDPPDPVEFATWSVDGDVLAYGDVDLRGRGILAASRDDYAISARRTGQTTSTSRGGELRIGGIDRVDGDLALRAQGDVPSTVNPEPSALFLSGEFAVAHNLELTGTTETSADTVIRTGGDLLLASLVRGSGDLAIESEGQVEFRSDVELSGGALAVTSAEGTRFTSTEASQTIQASSLSFGSGVSPPPPGQLTVFRDGDLNLEATAGDVTFAPGQRLIVAGDLAVAASDEVTLADTAALDLDVSAGKIVIQGGSNVVANHIGLSSRPTSNGPGIGTLATPTRTQISGDVAGANVVLRQIAKAPTELSQADLAAGIFPSVTGPAFFDFASQVPVFGRPASIVRPRADLARLALAQEARPLWADELLVYLDAASRQAPSAREQGALPPVGAGPNATTSDTTRERGNPALERTIALYRAVFRPSTEIDPETGILQGADRASEVGAAFTRAVDVAAAGRGGATPTVADVAAAIERDASLADARAYRADLAALIAAADRELDAEQRARFRELLLARVVPKGISQAELGALIRY
jgi:hypothetical protein